MRVLSTTPDRATIRRILTHLGVRADTLPRAPVRDKTGEQVDCGFDADADAASLDAPPPAPAAAGVQEVTNAEGCARVGPTCAGGERRRGGGAKQAPPEVPHEGVVTGEGSSVSYSPQPIR